MTGFNPLLATGAPFTPGTVIGSRFFLSGAPIPLTTANSQGQLIAFRPLQSLQTVFPVTDKTTFNSFRLDHLITKEHHLSFRFGYNPSTITGIQVESQNQSLGQNDFSRTGIQKLKDYSAVVTLASTLSSKMVNELRFNFGERRALFKSQNGDAVAFNISGTAFIGRELFSPVIRTETRYQAYRLRRISLRCSSMDWASRLTSFRVSAIRSAESTTNRWPGSRRTRGRSGGT